MPTASISSLPHELLTAAFKDLARDTSPEQRPLTSLHLTHVCRKFQEIALGCPQLWTTIGYLKNFDSTKAGVDCGGWVEAFLRRSKTLPLDVVVECRPFDIARAEASRLSKNLYRIPVLDKVYAKCLPHVVRWRSVTLRVKRAPTASEAESIQGRSGGGIELLWAEAESRSWSAPILEKTAFEFDPFEITDDDFSAEYIAKLQSIDFILGWNSPMLEAFEVQGCPKSFRFRHFKYAIDGKIKFGFKTITGEWAGVHLGGLLKGLLFLGRSLTTLTTLNLSFDQCNFGSIIRRSQLLIFESILEFNMRIVTIVRNSDQRFGAELERILRIIRFPKAHTFGLTLCLKDLQGLNFWKTAKGVVHNLSTYSVVENFNLKVTLDSTYLDSSSGGLGGLRARMALDLPLSSMRSLKHLNVQSAIDLHMFESGFQSANYPVIRSIFLDVPDYGRWMVWAHIITSRLRLGQRWTDFEKLTVTLHGENQEKTERVVPRDEIDGWLKESQWPCVGKRKQKTSSSQDNF